MVQLLEGRGTAGERHVIHWATGQSDIGYTIVMDLIGVLSTLAAFLAFFSSLRFSRPSWPKLFLRLFRTVVALTAVAVLIIGVAAIVALTTSGAGSVFESIIALRVSLIVAVGCMLAAVVAIFFISVFKG